MSCNTCYCDYISNCETTIIVNAQLEPLTDYSWLITDKFGNKYSEEFTTDENGFFTIDVADLPEGFFTQYSGFFKLEVLSSGSCDPVSFNIITGQGEEPEEFTCIDFDVRGGTFVKANLGCEFETIAEP